MVKRSYFYLYFLSIILITAFFYFSNPDFFLFFSSLLSTIIILISGAKKSYRNLNIYPISGFRIFLRFLFSFFFFFFIYGFVSLIFSLTNSSFFEMQVILFSIFPLFISDFLINSFPTGIPLKLTIKKKLLPKLFLLAILVEVGIYFLTAFFENYNFKIERLKWFYIISGVILFFSQLIYYFKNYFLIFSKGKKLDDKPLLVLGVDAADWKFLTPLIGFKKKSFFGELVKNGISMPMDTFGRRLSPIIWTAIATGVKKEKHGITGFINPDGKRGMSLFRSSDIKKPPFWLMANEMGRRSGVLNWMVNYPAYVLDGFMVGRFDNLMDKKNYYPEDIKDEFENISDEIKLCDSKKIEEKWLCERDRDLKVLKRFLEVALKKVEDENIEVFALYTNITDDLMHKFYQFYESENFAPEKWHYLKEDVEKYKNVILDTYGLLDDIFLEIIDLEKFNIILLSDHGARGRNFPLYTFKIEEFLRDIGIKEVEVIDNTIWNDHMDVRLKGDEGKLLKIFSDLLVNGREKLFFKVEIVNSERNIFRLYHSFYTRFPSGKKITFKDRFLEIDNYLKFINMASGNHDHEGVFISCVDKFKGGFLLPLLIGNPFSEIANMASLEERFSGFSHFFAILRVTGLLNPITTLEVTPLINISMGIPVASHFDGRFILNIFDGGIEEELLEGNDYFSEIYVEQEGEDTLSEEVYKKRLRELGYIE